MCRRASRVQIFGLLLVGLVVLPARAAADPPHMIFIMFDDLGYSGIGAFHDDPDPTFRIETPHLDELAANGLTFTQYYASSPVCSPTRATVMSGLYPADLGIRGIVNLTAPSFPRKGIPADVDVLPKLLQSRDFYTAHIGKWHIGGNPYPEFEPETKGYNWTAIKQSGDYFNAALKVNGMIVGSGQTHLTQRLVTQAITAVDEALAANKKIFMNLWFFAPHGPFCQVPDGFEPPPGNGQVPQPPGDPSTFDNQFDFHARLVNNADYQVSRLIQHLKNEGIFNDTLIVVTSDNGGYRIDSDPPLNPTCDGTVGTHLTNGRFFNGKGSVFEGGIRVPMIAHWPDRITAHAEIDSPITALDLFPTFAAVGGVPAAKLPAGLRGNSFADLFDDPGSSVTTPQELVFEHKAKKFPQDVSWAVRRGDFKLVHNGFGSAQNFKLFDLADDDTESNDLLLVPGSDCGPVQTCEEVRDDLEQAYLDWRVDTGRIAIAGFDLEGNASLGFGPDQELEVILNGSAANGGRLLLDANPRFDVHPDDFTFRSWIQPRAGTIGNMQAQTIAHKEGSWTLRINAQDKLALTFVPVACAATSNNALVGCGEPPQVIEIDRALMADRWYHVAFTTFQNISKGPMSDSAEINLYLWEWGSTNIEVATLNQGVAPPESTMNRVSLGAIDPITEAWNGRLYDPELFQARLEQGQLEALAGTPAVLADCPTFTNRNIWAGSPVPAGNVPFGSEWDTRVYQGRSPVCCNPSQKCNDGNACVSRGILGGATGALACVKTPSVQALALYACVREQEGMVIDDVNGDRFCCHNGLFEPFVGGTCP